LGHAVPQSRIGSPYCSTAWFLIIPANFRRPDGLAKTANVIVKKIMENSELLNNINSPYSGDLFLIK
jgi:hypothetical protein